MALTIPDYQNPILAVDAPDPGCIAYNNSFFCAHTGQNDEGLFPTYSSDDLVSWKYEGAAITELSASDSWGVDRWWAPEIHALPGGRGFLLYHTAATAEGNLCVGSATSDLVTGPFVPSTRPLLCNNDDENPSVGLIDSTFFVDDGTPYLIYKVDGNSNGSPTNINLAELTEDGLYVKDEDTNTHTTLITNDVDWEKNCVEGPWIFDGREVSDYLFLFYSGSMYNTVDYSVGVARSKSVQGPWEKFGNNPILHTNSSSSAFSGPGHCSVLHSNDKTGELAMLYHAHIGYEEPVINSPRQMLLDFLTISEEGWPTMNNEGVPSE